ncbi:hypothetical protein ACWCXX_36180 [Streptomyces sp. NPDC001732]
MTRDVKGGGPGAHDVADAAGGLVEQDFSQGLLPVGGDGQVDPLVPASGLLRAVQVSQGGDLVERRLQGRPTSDIEVVEQLLHDIEIVTRSSTKYQAVSGELEEVCVSVATSFCPGIARRSRPRTAHRT